MLYFGVKNPWRVFCWSWWKHSFNPLRYWNAFVYFWQRGTRGYADCDIWSLDMYLSQWLPSALNSMKGGPYPIRRGMTSKRWDEILDKMVEGFKAAYLLSNMEYDSSTDEESQLKKQEEVGLKLFARHFGSLWN